MLKSLINISEIFEGALILDSSVQVPSLECGALAHGGATKVGNYIYSGVQKGNDIEFSDEYNCYALFIPSTVDTDTAINNSQYVQHYSKRICELFKTKASPIQAKGSWYSDDLQKVVIEDITVLVFISTINPQYVCHHLNKLANSVKHIMKQEAVTVLVNSATVII